MSETETSARSMTPETNSVNSVYLLVRDVERPREEVVGAPRAKSTTSTVDWTSCSGR